MPCCRYTLKIGNFYLAPRPSIQVVEPDDFEQLTLKDSGGCANCGGTVNSVSRREFTFTLRYKGQGSLATAWSMFNRLEATLSAGCETNKQIGFERTVCDEPAMRYNIRSGWQRITESWSQRTKQRILTVELHLNLVAYNPDNLFDFGAGPFKSSFA